MVARLWWKDLRQFWPIWILIAGLALAVQPLLVHYFGDSVRTGELAGIALGWTCLYAYAVAAAAFAGERENRTLAWLDAHAADRGRVWAAKSSFALASTAALGLLLFAASVFSTERWTAIRPVQGFFTGSAYLLVVLGFGMMWSAVLGNALLAAVLSVGTSLCALPLLRTWLLDADVPRGLHLLLILVIATVGWLESWFLLVRTGPPRNALFPQRFFPAARAEGPAHDAASRPPSFRGPAVRSLIWQSWREARSLLGWLLLINVLIPPATSLLLGHPVDFSVWAGATLLVSLVAGISVFGNDLRMGSNRLLANHGVRPALIWLVRMAVWSAVVLSVAVCSVVAMLFSSAILAPGPFNEPRVAYEALFILCAAGVSFGIPVLCGMVIHRGITAGVVAILLWFLVSIPLGILQAMGLLPPVILVLVPLAILAVPLAWSGDWLVERPGAGRWLRLAGWCLGLMAALFATYVTVRATGVPRIDASQEARLLDPATTAVIPEAENAAPLYREAIKALVSPSNAAELEPRGSGPLDRKSAEWLGKNQQALTLLRRAAARPACQFSDLSKETVFGGWTSIPPMHVIPGLLLDAAARDRMAHGDLDGAWTDIEACFRLARHRMMHTTTWQAISGLYDERRALRLAMSWAADGRQTVARLRAAHAAYEALPALDVTGPIHAEAVVLRNTERLPRSELVEKAIALETEPRRHVDTSEELRVEMLTTPWELARTGRAWRLILAWMLEQAQLEPWQAARGAHDQGPVVGLWSALLAPPLVVWVTQSTPLIQRFVPPLESYLVQWDRNEVGRRALVLILAIRTWQIEHGGKLPERLEDLLASGDLDVLPTDPFTSRRRFGYIPAAGQVLLPLDDPGILWGDLNQLPRLRPIAPGRLLYSVGPDRDDDRASKNDEPPMGGDIVFPLAETPPKPSEPPR